MRKIGVPTNNEKTFITEGKNTTTVSALISLNLDSSPTTKQGCLNSLFNATACFQKKIVRHIISFSVKSSLNQERFRQTEGTYLSEMSKHVGAALTHFCKKNYRCVKDT